MSWGALIGAGMSALGGMAGDKSAKSANLGNIADIKGLYESGFNQAMPWLLKSLEASNSAYKTSKQAVGMQGAQGEKSILEAGKKAGASVTSDLVGKGLGNTTAVGNAQNQVTAGTQSALAGLTEQLGLLGAKVESDYAKDQMGINSQLANLNMWKADGLGGILGNIQHESGSGGLWSMAGDLAGGIDWGDLMGSGSKAKTDGEG